MAQRLASVIRRSLIAVLLVGATVIGWLYQENIISTARQFEGYLLALYKRAEVTIAPCRKPITYQLGAFDDRFGISKAQFIKNIEAATKIWENSMHKDLFAVSPSGTLVINLVYDYRQIATDRLKKLGYTIDNTKESYDALQIKYKTLKAQYGKQQATYKALEATYKTRLQSYEDEVAAVNARGGASREEADQLNQEKSALDDMVNKLNQSAGVVNQTADNLNALVQVINRLASTLNINASNFNNISGSRGQEFEEGLYTSGPAGNAIDIYEFNNQAQLVRLLAHELGHALGLDHLDNPDAIMYRLNQTTNEKVTADDLAALKKLCGIK